MERLVIIMITLITTPATNIPYLFAAYLITWAVFWGYVYFTSRRQQALEHRVKELRDLLKKKHEE